MSQRHPIQNNTLMLVTTVTLNREEFFKDAANAREAIETLYRVQERHPFFLYGFAIMPDHNHFLVNVQAPQTISNIMSIYKSGVTFNLRIPQMWQRRFHIRLVENGQHALQYIHMNPVKAGIVETPEEYLWSSACGKWDVSPLEG